MEWRRLTQPEEPAFGRAMALYEASFPRHEQRLPPILPLLFLLII